MKAMILTVFVFISILFLSFTELDSNSDKQTLTNTVLRSPLDLRNNLHDPKNLVTDKKADNSYWYSKVSEAIKDEENFITFNKDINSYQSPNRANNLRFIYHKGGFTAEPRITKIPLSDESDLLTMNEDKKYKEIPDWKVSLNLTNVNRETRYAKREKQETNGESEDKYYGSGMFANSELNVKGNKAFIEYENIRIDYSNNKDGMRQDFIIKNRPEGEGMLRLNLTADTKLQMLVGADALMFKDNNGIDRMKYSALKCWDANGKELRAYFENNYEFQLKSQAIQIPNPKSQIPNNVNSKLFSIVVNDEDAVYPVTIDPLSSAVNWIAESNQADASYGVVVATAGDVNGDGYSDVIIGAPLFDNGQSNEGKVFVYYGSAAGLSATPAWTAESDQNDAEFGNNAGTAGDVNGDGYSDIVVGAYRYDNGQNDEGRAFVYHGSASGLSAIPDWTAESNQADARFSLGVSTAGDVNGDGYGDLVVGAYQYDNTFTDEGCIFVYAGTSTGLITSPSWIVFGGQTGAGLGSSVSTAGDINADGYSDVIASAYAYDNGQTDEGAAFAYYGSVFGISLSPNWSTEGNQNSAYFGTSVSTAGDINGDGFSDVIVGAYLYDNGETDEGAAFVYNGSSSGLSVSASWTGEGNQNSASYGLSVYTAGDVNGDGYADVIVGAYLFDNGETDEGGAFVYNGSVLGLSVAANWTSESNQASSAFGWNVSTAGDVNGDGYSDVLSGARYFDNGQSDEGRVFEYNGSPAGLSVNSNWAAENNQASSHFGLSISSAGDINGDGYNDIIIGAPDFDNGELDEGRAYVYNGSSSGLSFSAGWTAEPDLTGAGFGYSVSTAGDVNDDGYCDVIIGSPFKSFGGAYVYFGSATGLSLTPNWTKISDQSASQYGISVSTAGDINGDGFSEVIVGANLYSNGQLLEGKAYAYYGSASGPSLSPDWSAESNQMQAEFGASLCTAGDVNGDGFSDVLIGCYRYDEPLNDEGKAFLYHGSSAGLSVTPNWTAKGNQADARYSQSLSTAGDVNGDGFSDVIVGAYLYDNTQTDEGCVFVYPGAVTGLSPTANWIGFGSQASAYYGNSVATAGDINGDGYSDIIVGAYYYDNGESDEGAAFVYTGSSVNLSLFPGWTAESNQANAYFGTCVSSAGDINGDGYSDVIVGAYKYDNGQSDEGKVFAYYGNDGTSKRSTMNQFKPFTGNVVYSGGLTGTAGGVRFNLLGRSPYGRTPGMIVYEYKENGLPFSGTVITNSTASSGSGINTNLIGSGTQLIKDVSGLTSSKEYKWRARVHYKLTSNPYQKFGPWKYYENFVPLPNRSFRPSIHSGHALIVNIKMFMQGYYDSETNSMRHSDSITLYLQNSVSPYQVIDSAVSVVHENGEGTFAFVRKSPCKEPPRKIKTKSNKCIDTWSSGNLVCSDSSEMYYDFTFEASQAYGNNMIRVDSVPTAYAIYSGDVNKDNIIDLSDVIIIYNDANNFVTGNTATELTGDYIVDLFDVIVAYNNSIAFVHSIYPVDP